MKGCFIVAVSEQKPKPLLWCVTHDQSKNSLNASSIIKFAAVLDTLNKSESTLEAGGTYSSAAFNDESGSLILVQISCSQILVGRRLLINLISSDRVSSEVNLVAMLRHIKKELRLYLGENEDLYEELKRECSETTNNNYTFHTSVNKENHQCRSLPTHHSLLRFQDCVLRKLFLIESYSYEYLESILINCMPESSRLEYTSSIVISVSAHEEGNVQVLLSNAKATNRKTLLKSKYCNWYNMFTLAAIEGSFGMFAEFFPRDWSSIIEIFRNECRNSTKNTFLLSDKSGNQVLLMKVINVENNICLLSCFKKRDGESANDIDKTSCIFDHNERVYKNTSFSNFTSPMKISFLNLNKTLELCAKGIMDIFGEELNNIKAEASIRSAMKTEAKQNLCSS